MGRQELSCTVEQRLVSSFLALLDCIFCSHIICRILIYLDFFFSINYKSNNQDLLLIKDTFIVKLNNHEYFKSQEIKNDKEQVFQDDACSNSLKNLQIGVCKNLESIKLITPFIFSLNENIFLTNVKLLL